MKKSDQEQNSNKIKRVCDGGFSGLSANEKLEAFFEPKRKRMSEAESGTKKDERHGSERLRDRCKNEKDMRIVRANYRIHALSENVEAMYEYAYMCDVGLGGPIEPEEAKRFYLCAAQRNHAKAAMALKRLEESVP